MIVFANFSTKSKIQAIRYSKCINVQQSEIPYSVIKAYQKMVLQVNVHSELYNLIHNSFA